MKNSLHNKISKIIKKVTNEGSAKLHEPLFAGKENQYLKDCIKTTFVSTSGKYIKRFEEKIKKLTVSNKQLEDQIKSMKQEKTIGRDFYSF